MTKLSLAVVATPLAGTYNMLDYLSGKAKESLRREFIYVFLTLKDYPPSQAPGD
jgi:hypothetical protein